MLILKIYIGKKKITATEIIFLISVVGVLIFTITARGVFKALSNM